MSTDDVIPVWRARDGGQPLPVTVLTGFLGAGKTTCLNRFLGRQAAAGTAVIVNEFGEIDVDGAVLAGQLGTSDLMRLPNGCICCEVQDDLAQALLDLAGRCGLRHCIVETTGLAEPGAILRGMHHDPRLQRVTRSESVVTVCAADRIGDQITRFPETARQIALADRIVLSKTDLVSGFTATAAREAIARINPLAAITSAEDTTAVFAPSGIGDHRPELPEGHHAHSHGVHSFTVRIDRPLDPDGFRDAMSFLIMRHAEALLRVKGAVRFAGDVRNHLIDIVHDAYSSRITEAALDPALVFIGVDLPEDQIRCDLLACRIAPVTAG